MFCNRQESRKIHILMYFLIIISVSCRIPFSDIVKNNGDNNQEKGEITESEIITTSNPGDQLSYTTGDGTLWLIGIDNQYSVRILENTNGVSWSPNGDKLIVVHGGPHTYSATLVNPNDSTKKQIFTSSDPILVKWNPHPSTSSASYIGICNDEVTYKYFIDTDELARQPFTYLCTDLFWDEIDKDVLPNDIHPNTFTRMPGQQSKFYRSDWSEDGTLVYDAEKKELQNIYRDWYIFSWPDDEFFFADRVTDNADVHGVYKVKIDGSYTILVPPILESSREHLFRSRISSSLDGKFVAFWELSREVIQEKDLDNLWNTLYIIDVESNTDQAVWRIKGHVRGAAPQSNWIPNSNKIYIYAPFYSDGSGALFVYDNDQSKIIPLAGSLVEGDKNINGINWVRMLGGVADSEISPTGEWIHFLGTKVGQLPRTYIVRTDGSELIKLGHERLAGSVMCGVGGSITEQYVGSPNWSPSGDYMLCTCLNDKLDQTSSHLCVVDLFGSVVLDIPNSNYGEWRPVPQSTSR